MNLLETLRLPDFLPLPRRAPHGNRPRLVAEVRAAGEALRALPDAGLRQAFAQLRTTVRAGTACTAPAVLVPAFALVVEAARRTLGLTLFDVQLQAGMALAQGAIAEMATGEGKTLAATLPAALHALSGQGVHVATPNAYLAARDAQRVAPIFQLLGLTVGLVPERADADAKRAAYACDVTYATGYELGFDFLRDQLQRLHAPGPGLGQRQRDLLRGTPDAAWQPIQARREFAIVDEIDSVLIDEACLPLVLSEGLENGPGATAVYAAARRAAETLVLDEDFLLDAPLRSVTLTAKGLQNIYAAYARQWQGSLELARPWAEYVKQALCARHVHRRDVDYVVQGGKILLVDEFTGRIFPDRTWRDGLHQAVEVQEGLAPTAELRTAARISRQRFFRLYRRICGMTGTARGSQREFHRSYRLPVETIPPQRPSRRELLPTRYFTDAESKWRAIAAEVAAVHAQGRPVLVGTRTIENSQALAARLAAQHVALQVLNGMQDHDEAEIIAVAGRRGAVTIATNMAGRGTDIVLGPGVADSGGMHVVGVERHESQRIDRQLLGRAGRQGDPGSGRFFVAADDPLLVRFGPRLQSKMLRLPAENGEILADLTRDVAAVQRAAEAAAEQQRRQMLAADRWHDEFLRTLGDQA